MKGSGTRGGNGKCKCNHGYTGDLCQECLSSFYAEIKNDTFIKCKGNKKLNSYLFSKTET